MKFFLALIFAGIALTWASTADFFRELLSQYDKDALPMGSQGTTNVKLGVYITHVTLDEDKSSMKVLMYFRQSWQDPRLAVGGNQKRRVPSEFIDKIWRPDTFSSNARSVQLKQEMTDERLMTINGTGVYADFVCDLQQPRSATCQILFESYGYVKDEVTFRWLDTPIQFNAGFNIPGYTLADTVAHDCSQNYASGAYPCLEVRLVIQKK